MKKSLYQYTLLFCLLLISSFGYAEANKLDRSPIQIWYGAEQEFGRHGLSQNWINILGTAWRHQPEDELSYQLDNGPVIPLTVGKTDRRLVRAGDFNIDINALPLLEKIPSGGSSRHEVFIKLKRATRPPVQKTIHFTLHKPTNIAVEQHIDFSQIEKLQEYLQINDGAWVINENRLHVLIPGYDRIIALGSREWRDMEVEFDVQIDAIDIKGFESPSNGPGLGIVLRWQGQHQWDDSQPATGWWPFGAIGMFRWKPNWKEPRFIIMGNQARLLAFDETGVQIRPERNYRIKMQATTESETQSRYRLKFWEDGQQEPASWLLEAFGDEYELKHGGIGIIAHHLQLSIGEIKIRNLSSN